MPIARHQRGIAPANPPLTIRFGIRIASRNQRGNAFSSRIRPANVKERKKSQGDPSRSVQGAPPALACPNAYLTYSNRPLHLFIPVSSSAKIRGASATHHQRARQRVIPSASSFDPTNAQSSGQYTQLCVCGQRSNTYIQGAGLNSTSAGVQDMGRYRIAEGRDRGVQDACHL